MYEMLMEMYLSNIDEGLGDELGAAVARLLERDDARSSYKR